MKANWKIGLQEKNVKGNVELVRVKQIEYYPVKDKQTGDIARNEDGKPMFGRLGCRVFRVNLEYTCVDGSMELCWVIWTRFGYNFHYPDIIVEKPSRLGSKVTESKPHTEGSKSEENFREWLSAKVGWHVAHEVMDLFADAINGRLEAELEFAEAA